MKISKKELEKLLTRNRILDTNLRAAQTKCTELTEKDRRSAEQIGTIKSLCVDAHSLERDALALKILKVFFEEPNK
jgi:hypothetical protein